MAIIIFLSFNTFMNRMKTSRGLSITSLTKEPKLMIQISLNSIDQQTTNINPNVFFVFIRFGQSIADL